MAERRLGSLEPVGLKPEKDISEIREDLNRKTPLHPNPALGDSSAHICPPKSQEWWYILQGKKKAHTHPFSILTEIFVEKRNIGKVHLRRACNVYPVVQRETQWRTTEKTHFKTTWERGKCECVRWPGSYFITAPVIAHVWRRLPVL